MKKKVNGIAQQIANLETQLEEHNLVLNTIKGMDDSRTCYRLIGGVLVEKNVGKVRPEVVDQTKRLAAVVGQMRQQIQKLESDADAIQKKYGYQDKPMSGGASSSSAAASSSSAGILV